MNSRNFNIEAISFSEKKKGLHWVQRIKPLSSISHFSNNPQILNSS